MENNASGISVQSKSSQNESVKLTKELLLESAQDYIALGLKVFILGESKVPLANCVRCQPTQPTYVHHDYDTCECLTCHGFWAATDDIRVVEHMIDVSGSLNLAIRTGLNKKTGINLIVFDAESHADVKTGIDETGVEVLDTFESWSGGLRLPETLRATSVSGGVHLYYRLSGRDVAAGIDVKTIGRVLPAVDIKAAKGYVGAPPSAGRLWQNWEGEKFGAGMIAELPSDVVAWLQSADDRLRSWRAKTSSDGRVGTGGPGGGSIDADLYRQMQKEGPKAGHREAFFNSYLFQLRKEGKSKELARDIVHDLWEKAEQPPVAQWYMPFHEVEYKLARIWATVEPDDDVLEWSPWNAGKDRAEEKDASEIAEEIREKGKSFKVAPSGYLPDGRESETDDGHAERFVRLQSDVLKYTDAVETWFQWCNSGWCEIDSPQALRLTKCVTDDIRHMADKGRDGGEKGEGKMTTEEVRAWYKHAKESEGLNKKRAIIQLAKGHPKIATKFEEFDRFDEILTCQNGTLNLNTREFVESFDPGNMCTMQTGVDYRENAKSDELQKFMDKFVPGRDAQEYFFKVLGSALFAGNTNRYFVVIKGSTTSGKSTITDTLMNCLGTYAGTINASAMRGNLDDKPRPDLLGVLKKRLVFASEGSHNWELHADQVKRITGGDVINARGMYSKKYVSVVPKFMPVIVTNAMPRMTEVDEALERRLVVLDMNQSLLPEEVDPWFKERFVNDVDVLEALFAELVKGYYGGIDNGIERPESARAGAATALQGLSDISEFIDFAVADGLIAVGIEIGASGCVKTSDLHAMYVNWLLVHGSRRQQSERAGVKQFSQFIRDVMKWEVVRSNGMRWQGVVVLS